MKYFIKNQKNRTMKKFFAIAIIAVAFAACNNSGEKKEGADTAAAKMDTAAAKMDTAAAKMDTAAAKMDTAATKMDSAAKSK
jgi:hypothetical protein